MEKFFGRTYSSAGDTSTDFLIKTRGDVKVQVGHSFVSLVRGGKIDVDQEIVKQASSKESITSDGIYITDDGSVYIKKGDTLISAVDGTNSTYVSYNKQEMKNEQQQIAQNNIGLVFDTLEKAKAQVLKGFVYITEEEKFYTVNNGEFTELKFEFPNPYPRMLEIANQEDTTNYALKLSGEKNGICFGEEDVTITYEDSLRFNAISWYTFLINDKRILEIKNRETRLYNDFIVDNLKSSDFSESKGFGLITKNNQTYLYVDNAIIRNDKSKTATLPKQYLSSVNWKNNVVISSGTEGDVFVNLKYKRDYSIGDKFSAWNDDKEIILTVTEVDSEDNSLSGTLQYNPILYEDDGTTEITPTAEDLLYCILYYHDTNYRSYDKDGLSLYTGTSLSSRIGDISNVKTVTTTYPVLSHGVIVMTSDTVPVTSTHEGIYADQSIFKDSYMIAPNIYNAIFKPTHNNTTDTLPRLADGWLVPDKDNSQKLITSSWFYRQLASDQDYGIVKIGASLKANNGVIDVSDHLAGAVDGKLGNTVGTAIQVVLFSGQFERTIASGPGVWSWMSFGYWHPYINDIVTNKINYTVTVDFKTVQGKTIHVTSSIATIADHGESKATDTANMSGDMRSGAFSIQSDCPDGHTIYLKGLACANNHNDSTYNGSLVNDGIDRAYAITKFNMVVFGYFTSN